MILIEGGGDSLLAQPSEEYPDIIVVSGSLSNVPLISEASFKKYIEILSHYSNSAFNDMEWQVKVPEYHTEQRLSFNAFINISDKLTMLVKCWVISFFSLSYSLGTIKSKIAQISGFLSYVEDSKISFTGIRRSFVLTFLSQYVDSPLLYNSMVCTILDFLDFASQNKITFSETITLPLLSTRIKTPVRRAPDQCVIDALDHFFFTHDEIPTDMRCVYLLLRLILNRISEVLNMAIDCLAYPEEGIFTILVPTRKETPLHRPRISKYSRSLLSQYTAILYSTLQKQREYAFAHQSDLPEEYSNFLFISSEFPTRLLTATDFNAYLKKVCEDNKILDSKGEIAHITSHHLRHIGVVQRLQSGIITPVQTKNEANHLSISTTMGYGYSSMHDESLHTSNILKNVFQDAFSNSDAQSSSTLALPPKKYTALQNNPFTRLIPGLGLCSNTTCIPRFESCLQCQHFIPDKYYNDYFLECSALIKKRLDNLYKDPRKNESAIKFNEKYLQLYNGVIERIKARNESA